MEDQEDTDTRKKGHQQVFDKSELNKPKVGGIKLKHDERMELAQFLTKRLVKAYGKDVLFIGVYGSVARNEDKEFSDLELIVITKKKIPTWLFIYKDIVVLIHSVTYKDAIKSLRSPDDPWWFGWVSCILYAKKLYGSNELLEKFREVVYSISSEAYKQAASNRLIWMLEFLNQVKNAYFEKDVYGAITSSLYLRNAAGEFVALLNESHYKSHVFRSLKEAKKFKKLPRHFIQLMTALGKSNNLETLYKSAIELWRNCLQIAKANNISLKAYSSYNEIKL